MHALRTISILGAALVVFATCKKTDETNGAGGDNGTGLPDCEPLCEKFAASGCDNAPSFDGCMRTCLALTSASACDADARDYIECADGVDVECSAANDPYFPGCGDEWLIAIGCAVTENPNPAIEQPCDDYCQGFVDAACTYSNPKSECYTNCMWLGATGTGCDDEWTTYLECANAVTAECLIGFPYAPGCGPDFTAYYDCMAAIGN